VALGNAGNEDSVPALARSLQDNEALVRGHSAWALGQIGGEQAAKALENSLGQEEDAWVREEIAAALKTIS
jgi:epoxyqueuosine reductase